MADTSTRGTAAVTSQVPLSAVELLEQLTLEEKLSLLHQAAPGIDRLGLAPFHTGTEALHGLSWLGTATVFPQPVGLAATWDPQFLRRIGDAVATEVRARHAQDPSVSLNVWAPVVNVLRHPLWGRTEEGYSEDPDLTAALATGYGSGLRGTHPTIWKTVPTLKHFLAYSNETDRTATSSHLAPQALREYELPAFSGPLASGCIGAVMPSYNLVNGRPTHASGELLRELRSWAQSSVAIVSDAHAPANLVDNQRYFPDHITSHAAALQAGIDSFTENDADARPTIARLTGALDRRLITEDDVDAAVLRILQLRERTGELSGEDPYRVRADAIDLPEHRTLAREAVARGVVVLANSGSALPLREPATIAVVGPFADHVVHDWYSGTPPYLSTIRQALTERYPDATVRSASGADRVALRSLTHDRYLAVDDGGEVVARATGADEDALFDVTDWGEGLLTLRCVQNGALLTGARWIVAATATRVGGWVVQESFRSHRHESGSVSLQHIASGRWLRVQHGTHLLVADGSFTTAERFSVRTVRSGQAAVAQACAGADVAVVAVGNDPHLLGRETEDRPHLRLPASSRETWRTAVDHADRAVLTIVSSYPYAVSGEAADAAAVVWTSHGGQELGRGLVDVLSGDVEPTGRLAQTWWASEADAGDLLEYDVVGAGMTYRYSRAQPLYGLGHGLGYTTVRYGDLRLDVTQVAAPPETLDHTPARMGVDTTGRPLDADRPGAAPAGPGADEATVTALVTIRNTGQRPAHELVAVYALAPELPVSAPRVRLAGWTRVRLEPGAEREVAVELDVGVLAVWDVAADAGRRTEATPGAFRVQPGVYRLASGSCAGDPVVWAELEVTGSPAPPRRPHQLEAHGFHAALGVVTSDRTREAGAAIELLSSVDPGWARFDRLDPDELNGVTLELARRSLPGRARAEVILEVRPSGTSAPWTALTGPFDVPVGGGRYDWRCVPGTVDHQPPMLDGPVDLRVVLGGAARLASIEFSW